MSLSSGSMDFSRLYLMSSKDLDSEKFYDALDSDFSNIHSYYPICNSELESKKKSDMIPICKKYLRFLDKSEFWGSTRNEYDVSLLLNYWLYDKLNDLFGAINTIEIEIGFGALQYIWAYNEKNQTHKPYYQKLKPNINIFKEPDWEKRKQLYEYYVDFDTLFKYAIIYDNYCEKYYKN
ncbi:CYIR protein [Plasmodium cynomolgi strain B]|uniref:CYIR protein n=1 Tax=Plasmodium cynomolgi (strain B) TaxID=1120755 RepID=K6UNV8_PLACD|nr:CYIR protein [Plasmodium cynomolgi strain B]GAB69848.1 CYIR protein [Plasmodium cynomolgi strain B]